VAVAVVVGATVEITLVLGVSVGIALGIGVPVIGTPAVGRFVERALVDGTPVDNRDVGCAQLTTKDAAASTAIH
jgi:hypothetical protein